MDTLLLIRKLKEHHVTKVIVTCTAPYFFDPQDIPPDPPNQYFDNDQPSKITLEGSDSIREAILNLYPGNLYCDQLPDSKKGSFFAQIILDISDNNAWTIWARGGWDAVASIEKEMFELTELQKQYKLTTNCELLDF